MTTDTSGHQAGSPRFSIVIPVRNEEPNIQRLVDEIATVLERWQPFEVVIVDDGSDDGSPEAIRRLMERYPWVSAIRHDRCGGKSIAERSGILHAKSDIVATIDGDGQNDPAELGQMIDLLEARAPGSSLGLVAGQRIRRRDNAVRRLSSSIANGVRRAVLKDGTRDTGCGLKAFDRAAYLSLPYFDNIHRFYPPLVRREGYEIVFIDVAHRERWGGTSKYGVFNRLGVGIVDLVGVFWLRRRRRLPQISEY